MIRDLVDSTALSDRFDPGIWAREPGVLLRDFPFAKSGRGAAQNLVDKGGGAAATGPGSLLHTTLDRPPRRIPKIRTSSAVARRRPSC